MEDEVYEFVNETQVAFKDEDTVNITYKGGNKEVELMIGAGKYYRPNTREVLPYKLINDISESFIGEDKECINKALRTAEDCIFGMIINYSN
ncbi:hypothetical protein [Halomonas sp. AOP35-4E-18]|uniref:hypothetical protein n=1 Tax=Halomonas sp. AOP35-4E-18 TaxID=3457686 RepID=UPI004033CF78